MPTELRNARITHTFLGREDHGIFTFLLHLDYHGAGQAAGGYALDGTKEGWTCLTKAERAYISCRILASILDTLEVTSWEKLAGTYCRVQATDRKVLAIGHVLKDQWVTFEDVMNKETCR